MEIIHIYHTNDLHSHFKDWPRIVTLLKERKAWHESVGDCSLLFDIGDHMDRWHPLSDATFGKGNVMLLNSAAYDGITIGNNEGITLPRQKLNELYDDANFPVLVANIYNEDGSRPFWAKPFDIYETKTGTKIGVIGLTANFTLFYERLQWIISNPLIELEKQLQNLEGKVDIIILLSHLGMRVDEEIARLFPKVDLILGGHTHHILHHGKVVNKSLLACAGKFGNYVGHVTLEVSGNTKEILNKKAWLYDTNELPELSGENEMITNLFMIGESLLQQKVTKLNTTYSENEIAEILAEALRKWCDADCAIVNEGLIINGLEEGVVTRFDLLQICPHPINPCVLNVDGIQLEKIIFHCEDEKWINFQMRGFGFRGKLIGKFLYDSVKILDGEIYLNNERLQYNKKYKIVVPDMFTFGHLFPEISYVDEKEYLLPEFLRDILEWQLKSRKLS